MILRRIFLSFVLLAVLCIGIAVLGLISTRSSNQTVRSLIDTDLPAAESIGDLGRGLMAVQAAINMLLNPNLNMEQRQTPHAAYVQYRALVLDSLSSFNSYLEKNQAKVKGADFVGDWQSIDSTSRKWIAESDKLFDKYRQWESTYILNPTDLLRRLEKYRGDHFALVSRMAAMMSEKSVSGSEVRPEDNLCAFGRWRESFEKGEDTASQNKVFIEAMEEMATPHMEFHQGAAEMYQLLKADPFGHQAEIRALFLEMIRDAEHVIGTFDIMIAEAVKAQNLYQEAADMSTNVLLPLRDQVLVHQADLLAHKRVFDLKVNEATISAGNRNILIMEVTAVLALVLSVVMAVLVVRNIKNVLGRIIGDLSYDAGELSKMSDTMAETSRALSDGSGQQSASMEECSAAIEELNSMTKQNAENARKVSELMTGNNNQMVEGLQAVEQMARAMDDIRDASESIGRIINAVEEIAFQTNILALNAAVEAARAGEAGQGFAVVADEVHNLAQRSAQASSETATLIDGSMQKVSIGLNTVRDIKDRFAVLTQASQDSSRMVKEIDMATQEQSIGMDQLSLAVVTIDKVTQDNAHNANEASRASLGLKGQADTLLEVVKDLQRVVGG